MTGPDRAGPSGTGCSRQRQDRHLCHLFQTSTGALCAELLESWALAPASLLFSPG